MPATRETFRFGGREAQGPTYSTASVESGSSCTTSNWTKKKFCELPDSASSELHASNRESDSDDPDYGASMDRDDQRDQVFQTHPCAATQSWSHRPNQSWHHNFRGIEHTTPLRGGWFFYRSLFSEKIEDVLTKCSFTRDQKDELMSLLG